MDKGFNLLLMISKRGFRHYPSERKFIASQLDWVYSDGGRNLAKMARAMMHFTMTKVLAIRSDNARTAMPITRVILSNDGTKKHTASEQLLLETGFSISIIDTIKSEIVEANNIVNGQTNATKPSELASYLIDIANLEVGARMHTGGSFTDFIIQLAMLISTADEWLIPLNMVYDNNEKGHSFSITFVAREINPVQCFKIEIGLL